VAALPRYRLRLHLQEFDLSADEILIGRGPTCYVTIDDPMLSRRHARIDLSGAHPHIEDLQSRNGTQLNGRPLLGRAVLEDGDRIRMGTQELVFLVPNAVKRDFRTTSGLTFCIGCAVPYPSSSAQCPHCGAVRTLEKEREGDSPNATSWTFHLLSQVVDRALDQGRLADAERMLSRGVAELEEQLDGGTKVEPSHVAALAECATRLGCALRTARWLELALALYRRAGRSPSSNALAILDALPLDSGVGPSATALRNAPRGARRAG
jgi:hypothetical protein